MHLNPKKDSSHLSGGAARCRHKHFDGFIIIIIHLVKTDAFFCFSEIHAR